MATAAASSLSAVLHAAATSPVPASHVRSAGRFLQCTPASACSATSAELPATGEHAAAAEHSEFPTKCHTKPVLADTDGRSADRYASAAGAAADAATTATADGSTADWHAPIPAAATTTTIPTAAVRAAATATTTTIPAQRAPIGEIIHPRPIQLPSTCSPATAPVSSRRQRPPATAANASSAAQRHDAFEWQHEPF